MGTMKTIATVSLLGLIALSLSACGVGEASNADEAEAPEATFSALPVEVITPLITDISATYHTTGAIASDAEARVLAKTSGEVIEVLVEEGDFVAAGQVLARLDGDRLRLEVAHARAVLDKVTKDYERNLQLLEKNLVSASSVESLRFDLESLRASFELKKLDYNYTSIRAPIAGVISSRDIKLGQSVDANATTFRVTDTSRLVAYLKIPQNEMAKFSAGHISDVHVDAMPDNSFAATIALISPTIDTTNGTFRATIYIENKDGLLVPGMFGRFDIAYEEHLNVLTIPLAALISEDSESVVYVVEDGSAVRRRVETGILSAGRAEILGGLSADEQIVVTGQGSLRDGSKVLASIPSKRDTTG
jgi:membrane fusion protein (multidrug efflux system)